MNGRSGYGCDERELARLVTLRTPRPIAVDGDLEKPEWRAARWSHRFVDLVSGAPGFLDTRVAALWDDERLYVGYRAEEPDVRATMRERDSFLWNENDLELFIGGEDCYYELQVNALGTVYEVLYVWQDAYRSDPRFGAAGLDLRGRDVDVLGGFQDGMRWGKHPRGKRWAFMDWDLPGLEAAAKVDGRINDPATIDRGWSAEIAIPWKGLALLAGKRPLPPRPGEAWRMDFSRFERLENCGTIVEPHPGWALNRHGVYDSHVPECFSFVEMSEEAIALP